jgi:predicted alpha/beta hydrolase family esterase
MNILLLPGLHNSGPDHWQSIWQRNLSGISRVEQQDWDAPTRESWVEQLDQAINASNANVILVAHSLGCALLAWWVQSGASSPETLAKVKAALLVAPPDVARSAFPAPSFAPMPVLKLPFPSIVVASENDSWCDLALAEQWTLAWGSEFLCIGAKGHINTEAGLADWPQGQLLLARLIEKIKR